MLLYCANVSGSRSRHLVGVQDTKYWDYLYSDIVLSILINWFVLLFLQCTTLHDCPFYETSPVSIRNTLFSTDYLVIVLAVYSKCLHVEACPNCTKIDAAHFLGSSATNLMTDE